MSNASRCANYRARRRDTQCQSNQCLAATHVATHVATLIEQIQLLTEANMSLREEVAELRAEVRDIRDALRKRKQPPVQSELPLGDRARVVKILPTSESIGKTSSNKTPSTPTPLKVPPPPPEFVVWWLLWPNKVSKQAALREFIKARRTVSAAELMEGVERYIANKPADREWCHPDTWLRKGRWEDQYTPRNTTPAEPPQERWSI